MAISESIFASSSSPAVRPSHLRKHDGLSPAEALERFEHEQLVLEHQLKECKAFYSGLLDIRSRRKRRELSFEPANRELVEGFHVKTQISSKLLTNDEEPVVVSLMGDLYIELELEEAVAYVQRREEYLTVSLLAIKDRITGMKAELEMDDNSFRDLLKQFQMATS